MEKDFDRWNQNKKHLHIGASPEFFHAREVWWCAVGVNVGVEADGKHDNFERPVLIIRKFNRESVIVVPLTSRPKDNPYHVVGEHEGERFAAVISQVRLISTKRLLRRIYKMDSSIFERIGAALASLIRHDSQTNRPPLARRPRRPHGHK